MRILSISNDPHNPYQGSGYVITGYINGLRERGHTVDAYGPEEWCIWNVHRGRRYLYPILMALFGIRVYRNGAYDLVELWGAPSWLCAVLLRLFWPDVRIVHHSNGIEQHRTSVEQQAHSAALEHRWFQADLSAVYDWGLQASDAIVTVSTYDVPFLEKQGYVSRERICPVSNPLPEAFIGQDVDIERQKRLGFCGSWIPRKGIDLIREDISSFLDEHPGWTFSIVGVGDQDVRSKFPEEVRGQIEVIPFLERPDLIDWYHSLSVFVLPSIYESFGLVIAEAMACGAAVVATNVGLAHTLTDREEALILPDPSSPHLKQALDQLARDETLRRTIAQNGYERVQELRWERAVDKLESIYTRLANETDGH